MDLIAVNDEICAEFSGEFSSKRGLMRIANRAVRQAYEDAGKAAPSTLQFDLFTAYAYSTSRSYSPITFDGEHVEINHMDFTSVWMERDMTEVDVALFLAAHGPGMYRIARSNTDPDGSARYTTYRLNFWDGKGPAARASALMESAHLPHIVAMQFISRHFGWCEGYRRVYPVSRICEHDGHTYSNEWWDAHHYTCPHCGREFACAHPHEDRLSYWDDFFGTLNLSRFCDECLPKLTVVTEESSGGRVVTDGLPEGFLADFHGHTVYASALDRCGICDTCGKVTTSLYRRGLHHYCAEHRPYDLRSYGHTVASEGDFRSAGEGDRALNLFLGVELETVADTSKDCVADEDWASTAKDIAELDTGFRNYVDTKHDGSLDYGGVEIVTKPATPLFHLNNDFWRDLLSYGEDRGVTTPSCCGLHIHVNRDFFHDSANDSEEQVTIDRFISLFADKWEKFSGRKSFYWCDIRSDKRLGIYPEDCERRKRHITKDAMGTTHNVAVNHTRNNPTVEFRFFAGTMNLTQLRASLECAAGLAIMARTLNFSGGLMEHWTWDDVKNELCYGLQAHGIPCEDFESRCKAVSI